MSNNWTGRTDWETVCRRASGRRHYNAVRQFRAEWRRVEVARLWSEGLAPASIARRLQVHRSTVSRDMAALLERWRREKVCPCCGR